MESFLQQLDAVFLGNTLTQWVQAIGAFIGVFLVFRLLRTVLARKGRDWRQSDHDGLELLAMLLASTSRIIRVLIGLWFAEKVLILPPHVDRIFNVIIVVGAAIQIARWASTGLRFWLHRRHGLQEKVAGEGGSQIAVLMFIGQLIIWALVTLLALDNLGVNITTLVAGLGIGGIAIALSVQTILSDLFASLSIAFDKPFVIGDTLRIDDIEGTVEQVGIKSTRLRSVNGEQIIVANADVLKSRVRNLGRMPERRVVQRLRVAYESKPEDISQVPVIAESVVQAQEDVRFVSCLLLELGVYAMEFELVYFVTNGGPLMVSKRTDAVNRGLFERFRSSGIRFAYPTERQLSAIPGAPPPASPAPK